MKKVMTGSKTENTYTVIGVYDQPELGYPRYADDYEAASPAEAEEKARNRAFMESGLYLIVAAVVDNQSGAKILA